MIFFEDIAKYVREKLEGQYSDEASYDAVLETVEFLSEEDLLKEDIN